MTVKNLVPKLWGRKNVPVRRQERDPFYALQRSMDRLFDDFYNDFGFGLSRFDEDFGDFSPSLDVSESDTEFKIAAELPGMDEKDIEVSLSDNMLTISGEKKSETEEKKDNYHRTERMYGSFKRSVALPNSVDADNVEATFKNGVLNITLPKVPDKDIKKINVKSS